MQGGSTAAGDPGNKCQGSSHPRRCEGAHDLQCSSEVIHVFMHLCMYTRTNTNTHTHTLSLTLSLSHSLTHTLSPPLPHTGTLTLKRHAKPWKRRSMTSESSRTRPQPRIQAPPTHLFALVAARAGSRMSSEWKIGVDPNVCVCVCLSPPLSVFACVYIYVCMYTHN